MSFVTLLTFIAAAVAIISVPGPTTTMIVANTVSSGLRAGALEIAGTQVGLGAMVLIVAFGLETVVVLMSDWLWLVKLAGAIYLIWLGLKLWRSASPKFREAGRPPKVGYFWQGLIVIWSNPKAVLLLGAFLPQFVQGSDSAFAVVLGLGILFMFISTLTDFAYAFAADRAKRAFSGGKTVIAQRLAGSALIGGGIWMALRES